jgi:hypothetical protein
VLVLHLANGGVASVIVTWTRGALPGVYSALLVALTDLL